MQIVPSSGPHLLGFDVIWIATILSAVATFAVMLAIYAATTVKDPMARRVKALNERRGELKGGLVGPTHKTQKANHRKQGAPPRPGHPHKVKIVHGRQVQKNPHRLDPGMS